MMADFPLTTLRKGFPVMFTFDDYHEIESTRRFLSVLFNAKFESFELGEEDVEDYKQQGVDLLETTPRKHYTALFQPFRSGEKGIGSIVSVRNHSY